MKDCQHGKDPKGFGKPFGSPGVPGHKYVDTTLGDVRLYDGTVPADCYRAIAEVVARLALAEGTASHAPESGELLALLNRLAAPQVSVEARMDLVEQVRRMVIKA